jgi:hypothetical protein
VCFGQLSEEPSKELLIEQFVLVVVNSRLSSLVELVKEPSKELLMEQFVLVLVKGLFILEPREERRRRRRQLLLQFSWLPLKQPVSVPQLEGALPNY